MKHAYIILEPLVAKKHDGNNAYSFNVTVFEFNGDKNELIFNIHGRTREQAKQALADCKSKYGKLFRAVKLPLREVQ